MSGYPILLEGTRIRALIVGAGRAAHRKAVALLESGATVRVVAPSVTVPLRALAAECPRLVLVERAYETTDIADAVLVIAATNARAVNAQVARDAHARGRLVNVADAADEGNCATVAQHRAGPLVVGVSAGGVPAGAVRVRDEIARRFDRRYGDALTTVGAVRGRLLAAGDFRAWAAAEQALLGDDFCAAVEEGSFAARAAGWAAGERESAAGVRATGPQDGATWD